MCIKSQYFKFWNLRSAQGLKISILKILPVSITEPGLQSMWQYSRFGSPMSNVLLVVSSEIIKGCVGTIVLSREVGLHCFASVSSHYGRGHFQIHWTLDGHHQSWEDAAEGSTWREQCSVSGLIQPLQAIKARVRRVNNPCDTWHLYHSEQIFSTSFRSISILKSTLSFGYQDNMRLMLRKQFARLIISNQGSTSVTYSDKLFSCWTFPHIAANKRFSVTSWLWRLTALKVNNNISCYAI